MLLAGYKEKQAIDFEVYPNGLQIGSLQKDGVTVTHTNPLSYSQRSMHCNALKEMQECRNLWKHGEIDVDYIKCCMADHIKIIHSLCARHPPIPIASYDKEASLYPMRLLIFEAGVVHTICAGPPCTGDYRTYVL